MRPLQRCLHCRALAYAKRSIARQAHFAFSELYKREEETDMYAPGTLISINNGVVCWRTRVASPGVLQGSYFPTLAAVHSKVVDAHTNSRLMRRSCIW